MTKQHFIALANMIREWSGTADEFSPAQIYRIADLCAEQNPRFDRSKWLGYVNGSNGPNGGKK